MTDSELRELASNGESMGCAWDLVLPLLDRLKAADEQTKALASSILNYKIEMTERIAKLEVRIKRHREHLKQLRLVLGGKVAEAIDARFAADDLAAAESTKETI